MTLLSSRLRLLALVAALALAGCASAPTGSAGKSTAVPRPSPPKPTKPAVMPPPKPLTDRELVEILLPADLVDRGGWAADIVAVFETLRIRPNRENVCAALAEIAQESSFQVDPAVPGLGRIVRKELEARRVRYGIPQWLMAKSLAMQSPDGKTYDARIDALRTENDVSDLYEDMISEIPFGKKLFAGHNPVRTGGPMQVNAGFAAEYAAARGYPFAAEGSVRRALFTRKGGVYFGIAYLLDYPANYDSMRFRFADFHSGRYSSRNAAFQKAVSALSGIPLNQDGDLLNYKDGVASEAPSRTMRALLAIAPSLGMDRDGVYRDLLLEKSAVFGQSMLYRRVYAFAPAMPRASIPDIVVSGPKFTRKLTTASYVKRVDGRYRDCLNK